MKYSWGNQLLEKRFGEKKKKKERNIINSTTEFGGVNKILENICIGKKKITGGKPANAVESEDEMDIVEELTQKYISELNFDYSIPPRVPYENIDKEVYSEVERNVFNHWKSLLKVDVYERNIEMWRQFWLTCERSDIIMQIVDSRNPKFFMNDDIRKFYPSKKHVLLANKEDLTSKKIDLEGYDVFYYSALGKNTLADYIMEFKSKTVGFIGYPNVGKSSTINMIVKTKKVRVSETPGKTKYLQTIPLSDNIKLLDCPGLVFPIHKKIDLIIHGILNVDQLMNLNSCLDYVIGNIGVKKLMGYYNIKAFQNDSRYSVQHNFIVAFAEIKGWDISKCLKLIIKDFASGKISYDQNINNNFTKKYDWIINEY